jgi:hypothetical protein
MIDLAAGTSPDTNPQTERDNDMFDQITKITKFATEASTTINENAVATSDQILDAILDANRRIVDAAVTAADRIGEQVKVELPFADRFPTPSATGERYLEFVERAVSINREMNHRVIEMIKADNAKPAAKKPAEKAATPKAATKSAVASK